MTRLEFIRALTAASAASAFAGCVFPARRLWMPTASGRATARGRGRASSRRWMTLAPIRGCRSSCSIRRTAGRRRACGAFARDVGSREGGLHGRIVRPQREARRAVPERLEAGRLRVGWRLKVED